jgi:hypothetical protein
MRSRGLAHQTNNPTTMRAKTMSEIAAIQIDADMLTGTFKLAEDAPAYMDEVRKAHAALARTMILAATKAQESATAEGAGMIFDIGRFRAGMHSLQASKNLFCDAIILGNEADNRKRKAADQARDEDQKRLVVEMAMAEAVAKAKEDAAKPAE